MALNTQQHQRRVEHDVLRDGILILAVVTTGLMAGTFTNWSNTVMPGLGEVDDRTFVVSFKALDEAITNPIFQGVFTVALLLIALSVALHLRSGPRLVLILLVVALVVYAMVWVITFGIHEPLNEKIRTAGGTGTDFAAARGRLDEARWTAWNTARALCSLLACVCLACALGVRRRAGTAPPSE